MEIDVKLSSEAVSFIRSSINKIYEGEMVYCSASDDGIEVWHECKCKYMLGDKPGIACAAFMNSPTQKKVMTKNAPSFERNWQQRNVGMAVFKLNNTHFVFRTDNKQYNFEIPKHLREEMIAIAKHRNTFAEFKPILAVASNPKKLHIV